jgi:hypothetical protein
LVETIKILDEIGSDMPFTVEVISYDHEHLPPSVFLRIVHDATRKVLHEARGAAVGDS